MENTRRFICIAVLILLMAGCANVNQVQWSACQSDDDCADGVCVGGSCSTSASDAITDTGETVELDIAVEPLGSDSADESRLGFGEECTAGADCASDYCIAIDVDGSSICTEICTDSCPDGFVCRLLTGSGPDAIRLCTPHFEVLCRACQGHAACGGFDDLCLEQGNGHFCATDCAETRRCADGFLCNPHTIPSGEDEETFWQCEPETGQCPEPGEENDCGGFSPLPATPGTECGDCGGGVWICNGREDVRCVGEAETNACGGCDELLAALNDPCGTCGSGQYRCQDDGTLRCDGDAGNDALNDCGGCLPLDNDAGSPCGTCGDGLWQCSQSGALFCTCEPCDDECDELGGTYCPTGSTRQTCGDHDADVCWEWGDDYTCPSGLCVGTTCSTCDNDCPFAGDTRCSTGTVQQTCGYYDEDTCREWGEDLTCPSGVCSGTGCVACSNECAPDGVTRCLTGLIEQTCGNYDADTCLEWGENTSCPSGICSGLECVVCTSECLAFGDTHCASASAQQTCGNEDADSCLEWGPDDPCPSGVCAGLRCVACADDCSIGDDRCFDTLYLQSCGDYDVDTCLEWGGDDPCPSGYCVGDACTYCGDGSCNGDESPDDCPGDCNPEFLAQERLGRRTIGSCVNTDYGWHEAGGIVYWTFGTSCPIPSLDTPDDYDTEYGRWRFSIRSAGHYQVRVKIPPTGAACDFATSKYTTEASYTLDRPGDSNPFARVDQRSNIGSEAIVFADVYLNEGEAALYLYDSTLNLSNCCDTCGQSIRVFFDYAVFEWLGP